MLMNLGIIIALLTLLFRGVVATVPLIADYYNDTRIP
jgi:hypothetical protein